MVARATCTGISRTRRFHFVQILRTKTQCVNRKNTSIEGVIVIGHVVAPLSTLFVTRRRSRNVSEHKTTAFCSHNLMKKSKKSLLMEITGATDFRLRFGFKCAFECFVKFQRSLEKNDPFRRVNCFPF